MARRIRWPAFRPAGWLFLVLVVWGWFTPLAPAPAAGPMDKEGKRLARLAVALEKADSREEIDGVAERVREIRDRGQQCVDTNGKALAQLKASLEPEAEPAAGAAGSPPPANTALEKKRAALQGELAACRYIVVQADDLLEAAARKKRALQRQQLFYREDHILGPLATVAADLRASGRRLREALAAAPAGEELRPVAAEIVLLAIGVFLLVFWAASGVRRGRGLAAAPLLAGRLALALAVVAALAAARLLRPGSLAAEWGLFAAVLGAGAVAPLGRTIRLFLFTVLLPVAVAAYLLLSPVQGVIPPEILAVLRFAVTTLVTLLLLVAVIGRRHIALVRHCASAFEFAFVGNLLATAAFGIGYQNFGRYLFVAVNGSVAAFILVRRSLLLFDSFLHGWQSSEARGWQRLRALAGVEAGKPAPLLVWVRILVKAGLWLVFLALAVRLWDPTASLLPGLTTYLVDGVRFGSLTLMPIRLAMGFVVFGLAWWFFGWLARRVGRELKESHLGKAARDTVQAIFNYSGFGLALVFGLGTAGMDFSSLAMVAGALSVGIGFGLQNIVNNFVSGLILLFERPIKRGDWIVVGDTEGYVKKISVRSTIIRTFDKADVIVPNSELIAAQVTNWMLSDRVGRLKIPVGVAYGSDTGLVKELLLEVARSHPLVITDGSEPEPYVLFRGFGDSSLDFELRCFVRDVDMRLRIISDLNFAIDAAFRARGVEIPFPQRDVHIKQ